MSRTRPLAIALPGLLVLAAMSPRARTETNAPAARDVLPFHGHREDASQRPEGHRRADGLSQHRVAPDSRADRIAQRGRAGQVRLRALLRAHDVPRHAELYPPEKYQGHPDAGGRPPERVHDRRLHQLPHDLLEGRPRADASGRGRPLPEPDVRSGAAFKTEARAVLGEYNKNSANPHRQARRGAQHEHAFTTHTYKHTTMGFIKDIENMPNQYAYSKEFFARWYRPEYTTVIVAGDVEPDAGSFRLVEKYWGGWKRGPVQGRDPAGAAGEGPVVSTHVPWSSAHAALGERRVPRPGVLRHGRRTSRRSTCSVRSVVRRDVRPLQEARRDASRRWTSSSPTAARRRIRRSSPSMRA